ncbi:hypothetical protein GIY56_14470 [Paracoccus sp. YIM 132242]|uniref:Uncharacterized protein n=1 Tax=Paracoccus lichenicola TaxID=2665644 RepID=A0A6L6HT64_9RHOB|nr:hypothetical protein [Paracoccus lichenicola]
MIPGNGDALHAPDPAPRRGAAPFGKHALNTTSLLWPAALSGLIAAGLPGGMVRAQDAALHPPPRQECLMSGPRARAARLAETLQDGFAVQYWGTTYDADTLSRQPHGLLILEVTRIGAPYSDTGREVLFTPEEMARINRGGARPALGYLNVTEIEHYRDYWIDRMGGIDAPPPAVLPDWYGPATVHKEHLSAFWTDAWHAILLERVDRLMQTGIDGLFLDDVLHYYSHAMDKTLVWPPGKRPDGPKDAPGMAREMMRLVGLVADRARQWKCDAFVVVNNGVFIGRDAAGDADPRGRAAFSDYLDRIDAIMVENVSAPSTHVHTTEALQEDYRSQGVAVLSLDIATQFPPQQPEALRALIAQKAAEAGFYPYVTADNVFNQVYPAMRTAPRGPGAPE